MPAVELNHGFGPLENGGGGYDPTSPQMLRLRGQTREPRASTEREALRAWRSLLLKRSVDYLKRADFLLQPAEDIDEFIDGRLKFFIEQAMLHARIQEVEKLPEDLREAVLKAEETHNFLPLTGDEPDDRVFRIDMLVEPTPDFSRVALVCPNYDGLYPGFVFQKHVGGKLELIQGREFTLHELAEALTALPPRLQPAPQA